MSGLSIICDKCSRNNKKIPKEEKSTVILKILSLINKMNKEQKSHQMLFSFRINIRLL